MECLSRIQQHLYPESDQLESIAHGHPSATSDDRVPSHIRLHHPHLIALILIGVSNPMPSAALTTDLIDPRHHVLSSSSPPSPFTDIFKHLFFCIANSNRSSKLRLPHPRSRPSSRTSRPRSRTSKAPDLSTSSRWTMLSLLVPRSAAPSTRWSKRANGPPQATTRSSEVSNLAVSMQWCGDSKY